MSGLRLVTGPDRGVCGGDGRPRIVIRLSGVRFNGLARNGGWRDLLSPGWGEGEYGSGCGVGRPAAALAFPCIRAMMRVLPSFDAFLIL